MSEHYEIAGASYGEPLPEGRVGVRVRVPLSGCPSARWSRDLSARLAKELVGHPAVGHLRLNDIVHGDHVVLEGVEQRDATRLSEALRRAIEATNAATAPDVARRANLPQDHADAVARAVGK